MFCFASSLPSKHQERHTYTKYVPAISHKRTTFVSLIMYTFYIRSKGPARSSHREDSTCICTTNEVCFCAVTVHQTLFLTAFSTGCSDGYWPCFLNPDHAMNGFTNSVRGGLTWGKCVITEYTWGKLLFLFFTLFVLFFIFIFLSYIVNRHISSSNINLYIFTWWHVTGLPPYIPNNPCVHLHTCTYHRLMPCCFQW